MIHMDAPHLEMIEKFMRRPAVDISDPTYKAHYLLVDGSWYEMPESVAIIFSNMQWIHQLPIVTDTVCFKYRPIPAMETYCIQAKDKK